MIRRSIRWRLQAWHGVLLLLVVLGFGFTAHQLAMISRMRLIDDELQAQTAQLAIAVPPTGNRTSPFTESIVASGCYFAVWQPDGSVRVLSSNAPSDLKLPPVPHETEAHQARTRGELRELYHFTTSGRCFLVGRSIGPALNELRTLDYYLAAAGAGVLALGLLGGWWVATRAIRPIAAISETAEKIAAGDLSQRIQTDSSEDELGRLAGVLNSTFSRLDAAFTQQQRFTADAAHELRTPVTAVLMHSQNGLATEPLSEDQREAFEACQRAAQRMRRLIDSLLELARLDAGQEPMKHDAFDLADVASDCVDLVQTLADLRNVTLDLRLDHAPCAGDSARIGQVVTNLLTNAIEYTRDKVTITTRIEHDAAVIRVADNGKGVAPDDLPHLFERFYRADAARTSSAQHSGLGLAISKAIVDAHSGTLQVVNSPDGGASFEMRLPT